MMPTQKLNPEEQKRLREIDKSALWHPFTQMRGHQEEDPPPPIVVAAEGNWLIDADGKRYLDANCGYWCLAMGCRPERVENAIAAQLKRFSHSTLLGLSHQPAIELADRITSLAGPPLSHAFFASSGSEAVEIALKMAYQYQVLRGHPERSKYIAFGDAYHGDTVGCVALGGIDLFHGTFGPLLFPVVRVAPPYGFQGHWEEASEAFIDKHASAVEKAIEENFDELAALVIEPLVLGPGGVIPQPTAYLQRVVDAAQSRGVPVVFDEVAVGMGRLGRLFAFQEIDRKPDIICLAKGITAGLLPLSAVLASDDVYNTFLGSYAERRTFFHGHTFTGSALGCAAALEALKIFTENDEAFLRKIREETIPAFWKALEPLRALPIVKEVRGRGMMAAIEVCKDKSTGEAFEWEKRVGYQVILEARRRGVNTRTIGDIVLCVPPLTITGDEIELLGSVMGEALETVWKSVSGSG